MPALTVQPRRPSLAVMEPSGDAPVPQDWLTDDQKRLFRSIVSELRDAGVEPKRVDSHAIMLTVQCIDGVKEAQSIETDPDPSVRLGALQIKLRFIKDALAYVQAIGGTGLSRARMGLKTEQKKKLGPLAQILAAKQLRHGS